MSLNGGCWIIGFFMIIESVLHILGSLAWVNFEEEVERGTLKAIYGAAGIFLLVTGVMIIYATGKEKYICLKLAALGLPIPAVGLAIDSIVLLLEGGPWELLPNLLPTVLTPYFIMVLCSYARELKEIKELFQYESGENYAAVNPV